MIEYKLSEKYPSWWKYPKYDKNYVVIKYALNVVNNKIKACETEILACRRFLNDLERSKKSDFPYVFDYTRSDRFFRFAKMCVHIEGVFSGQPIELDDWQKFDFGNMLGWVHKITGKRRFNKALIFNPRGQAKSTGCAILSLYGLNSDVWYPPFHPEERQYSLNPRITCIAVDKQQAREVRDSAFKMAQLSPKINEQVIVKKTYIENKKRDGQLNNVSRDASNKDGGKDDMIIADEYAAWKDEKALNTLVGGFGKKPQCLLVIITTAGDDASTKPALNEYNAAIKILNGEIIDDKYAIMIRQMPNDMKIDDFDNYEVFTPILRSHNEYGKQLLETIKDEYKRAFEGDQPNKKREYLIKRCNLWQVDSEEKYLDSECLAHLRKAIIPQDEFMELIYNHASISGFDFSKKVDLTGMAELFKLTDGRYAIYTKGYIPKEAMKKHERTDGVPYTDWVDKDYIMTIEGDVIDTYQVMTDIVNFEDEHKINNKEGVYDPAWCYQFACDMSEGRNVKSKKYNMVEMPQTTTHLNEPTQKFKELVLLDQLVICENKCFEWCCENAYIVQDKGGREKIAKKNKDSTARIDLLAATLFAIARIDTLNSEDLINALKNGTFSF